MIPKSEKILEVIRNFEKLPQDGRVHMSRTIVSKECNCHGGWYLIAATGFSDNHREFLEGVAKLNEDLGFDPYPGDIVMKGFAPENTICKWAGDNPELWGNKKGSYMFSSHVSLHGEGDTVVRTVADIVWWWKQIYDRVKKLEDEFQEQFDNILAEVSERERAGINF